jgi:hypothetical protein
VTTETIVMTDRTPVSFWKKINPLWWLVGPDGWNVPDVNNGEPYLPEVTNIWLRRFYWFICRNPLMNFVGYVLGVEDNNYRVEGTAPVLLTTWRDATPPKTGWKWALLWPQISWPALLMAMLWIVLTSFHPVFYIPWVWAMLKFAGPLPFISYNGAVEFYMGWRPASGGFGTKIVLHND